MTTPILSNDKALGVEDMPTDLPSSSQGSNFGTVLVTGGAGFIGSHLVRRLLADGCQRVINFDKLTYAGNLAALVDVANHPRYLFVRGDVADAGCVTDLLCQHTPDAILHLAAESHVDRSIAGPADFVQTNVVGSYTLFEAARGYWERLAADAQKRFRIVHVSTDEVYGSLDFDDPPFNETSRYAPRSPYAATKAASDHLARAWHTTYGLPVVVTHSGNNFGPWQHVEKLIPVVIDSALQERNIPVYGTGDNVRDWIYVEDNVAALAAILKSGVPGRSYNIGAHNEWSNVELIRKICGILDETSPRRDRRPYVDQVAFVADRPGHDLRYAMTIDRLATELHWHPVHDFEIALRATVAWYVARSPRVP